MERMVIVFFAMLSLIAMVTCGGIYAENIIAIMRRRVPTFSYEGEIFMLWGLVLVAAFALGLVVMYLLLKL